MAYTLSCKDTGIDCPYVAKGETDEELWADAGRHAIDKHGYTDEQVSDPKFKEENKSFVKQT